MVLAIRFISNKIAELLESRDTRLDHLPFTSPLSVILVAASYFYFVKHVGPSFMRGRKPFTLQTPIAIYNLIQIILNAALVVWAVYAIATFIPEFNFACQPVDFSTNAVAILEAKSVYCYYCLKLLDLCDTVLFVLKKNTRQVSFLHVYHHLVILISVYRGLAWASGGHFLILGPVNCFVHTVMYTYYLCCVFHPELKKNVKIKKMVTKIQMVQFVALFVYFLVPLLNPDCPVSKSFLSEAVLQNAIMICLFANFYHKNYWIRNINKKL